MAMLVAMVVLWTTPSNTLEITVLALKTVIHTLVPMEPATPQFHQYLQTKATLMLNQRIHLNWLPLLTLDQSPLLSKPTERYSKVTLVVLSPQLDAEPDLITVYWSLVTEPTAP